MGLDLEVTRRCNLRCDYCFVGWSRDWVAEIPRETALEIVDEGAGQFDMLHITGGEPFVYKPIWEVIERGLERGYREVFINTNGTVLRPNDIRRLTELGPRVTLSISLDGPEELHDPVRGTGRYRQSMDTLAQLLDYGVRVTVNTVVTPPVLERLTPFVRGLAREHPRLAGMTLFLVGVGPVGSQKPGKELRPLHPEEVVRLARLVAILNRLELPIGVGAYPIINPLLLKYGYPPDQLYQCTAGRGRVCVHADLTVSPCHPVKEAVYGRWRPRLLRELGAFPAHQTMARRDYPGCRACEHRDVCGHCRAYVSATQPVFGNDKLCLPILETAGVGCRRGEADAEIRLSADLIQLQTLPVPEPGRSMPYAGSRQ